MGKRACASLTLVLSISINAAQLSAQSGSNVSSNANAQQSANGLSFEDVFALASRDNLQIRAARLRSAVAATNILIAGQRPNPDFITSYTRSEPRMNYSISQPIEMGGKRARRLDVARGEARLAELDVESALRTLRHDARVAYFNLALARDTLGLGRQGVEQAQRLAEIAQARFEAGDIAQFEVLQARLAVSRAENDLARLENLERIARAGLNILLNRTPETALDLRETLFVPRSPVNASELTARALTLNVELRAADEQIRTEQSRLRLAHAQRIPDLLLEPGIESIDSSLPNNYGFKMQVTVPLPLFNRSRGEISHSNALIEQLTAERDAARQRITSEIGQASLRLETARQQVNFYETRLLPEAVRVSEMALEAYRAGQTGILPVVDAQRNFTEVRQGYLQALFDYQSALADLEQAAGVTLR